MFISVADKSMGNLYRTQQFWGGGERKKKTSPRLITAHLIAKRLFSVAWESCILIHTIVLELTERYDQHAFGLFPPTPQLK